jgi:hypothetical protein
LGHLSPYAGWDADCERCGATLRDFYGFGISSDEDAKLIPKDGHWWIIKTELHD